MSEDRTQDAGTRNRESAIGAQGIATDSEKAQQVRSSQIPAHVLSSIPSLSDVDRFDLLRLTESLTSIELESTTRDDALEKLIGLIQQLTNACAVIYFKRDGEDDLAPAFQNLAHIGDDAKQVTLSMMQICAETCSRTRFTYYKSLDAQQNLTSVTAPVETSRGGDPDVLSCIFVVGEERIEPFVMIVQFIANAISMWEHSPTFTSSHLKQEKLEDIHWLNQIVLLSDSQETMKQKIADGLLTRFSFQQVVLGEIDSSLGGCRLATSSGVDRIEEHSSLVQMFEQVFQETLDQGRTVVWPESETTYGIASTAMSGLISATRADLCVFVPLVNSRGKPVGVLGVLCRGKSSQRKELVEKVNNIGIGLGVALDHWSKVRTNLVSSSMSRLKKYYTGTRSIIILAVVLMLAVAMAVPIRSTYKCKSTIEPVSRRYVAAPFEGKLDRVLVRAGDFVEKGEMLARLDGQEIRMELASLDAQRQRARKLWNAYLAENNVAEAQIAEYELMSIEQQYMLLKYREKNLEIFSPIDGVVISGDLEKDQGAPLRKGQVLFEIAPTQQMVAEIEIPDEDITYVKPGQEASIRLNARPDVKIHGILQRVYPSSEQRDSKNVFVGEVQLDSPPRFLKVGMDGTARVRGQKRPMGWVLFHRFYDYMLMQIAG